MHAAAAAKLFQSCPTLCDSIDGSPQGSAVPEFSRQEHWSGLPLPSPRKCMRVWKEEISQFENSKLGKFKTLFFNKKCNRLCFRVGHLFSSFL